MAASISVDSGVSKTGLTLLTALWWNFIPATLENFQAWSSPLMSCHSNSIGIKSGLWEGHYKTNLAFFSAIQWWSYSFALDHCIIHLATYRLKARHSSPWCCGREHNYFFYSILIELLMQDRLVVPSVFLESFVTSWMSHCWCISISRSCIFVHRKTPISWLVYNMSFNIVLYLRKSYPMFTVL